MPSADYFRYLPVPREADAWGLAVTAAGFTRVQPGMPYPPARHPSDHDFNWERGRILEALQVVVITAGRGYFEMRGAKPLVVGAGDAFMVLPGLWHRYRPDETTGWVESWVELSGDTVDRLRRGKILSPRQPVLHNTFAAGVDGMLETLHARLRQPQPGFDPQAAAIGYAVLAAWRHAGGAAQRQTRIAQAVAWAARHLAENMAQPVNMAALP